MNHQRGFTLVEILVALVVFATAITAGFIFIRNNTRNLAYLETKTLAHLLAENISDKIRVGLLPIHDNDQLANVAIQGGKHLHWLAKSEVNHPHQKKITVTVNDNQQVLASISFMMQGEHA